MKAALFLVIGMILPMFSHAQEAKEQRFNITPSQLAFTENGMFALIEGEWVPLEAVYSEAGGILAAIKKDPNLNRWICVCKYNNNGWDTTCQRVYGNGEKCGLPRPW